LHSVSPLSFALRRNAQHSSPSSHFHYSMAILQLISNLRQNIRNGIQ
jgi:hypothetical protein